MITREVDAFFRVARACARDFGPATARAAFLVAPEGFTRADESARDNRYMARADGFDADAALGEHRVLQRRLSQVLPTLCFPGDPATPDAVFPNNVFATVAGRAIVGRMRHPVRQREAARGDIRGFFRDVLGYREIDLSDQPHPCELTGALVVDRARGLGFCGLSERCDPVGAQLMHDAFGLRATLLFDLAAGEYHTNVVLAVLAGRAALVCPQGFADPSVAEAIAAFYGAGGLRVDGEAQAGFVANAISLSPDRVWMSARAGATLPAHARDALSTLGFAIETVPLPAIEAAGGSLRCCVAEIF
ncbi:MULTISPECIES: arginine deiminase-related protein [Luteimonas]|uniref:arginine deiminase-related protein n=1 Tax=Luteimonas TaxID=83614 RepID=UPI000C7B6251|nr:MULTISPECIES: arginine deiminase-related protein [Luteimonas]